MFEERTQKWEIAGDNSDAHLHECPAAGVDLGICCIVGCEVHDGGNSYSAGDADTFSSSAISQHPQEEHLQATEHEYSNQGNFAPQVDVKLPDHRNWQAEDHDISEERQRPVYSAANSLILAVSMFYGLVIEECDWSTDG